MAVSASMPGGDAVEELDHGDLGAQPAPHRAQLQPDDAGADHDQALGDLGASARAPVESTIRFWSKRDARQRQGLGAGGDDDVPGGIVGLALDRPRR